MKNCVVEGRLTVNSRGRPAWAAPASATTAAARAPGRSHLPTLLSIRISSGWRDRDQGHHTAVPCEFYCRGAQREKAHKSVTIRGKPRERCGQVTGGQADRPTAAGLPTASIRS